MICLFGADSCAASVEYNKVPWSTITNKIKNNSAIVLSPFPPALTNFQLVGCESPQHCVREKY